MEIILKILENIKENKKKIYIYIILLLALLISLVTIISFSMNIDPFIYFQF
mgnify:FL=1